MKYDSKRIVDVIHDAIKAAQDADPGPENDGGTCNFDCAYLRVPGMREAQFDKIASEFPAYTLSLNDSHWHGRMIQLLYSKGQAMRRTTMAEAAGKVFKESGLEWGMYYQMD